MNKKFASIALFCGILLAGCGDQASTSEDTSASTPQVSASSTSVAASSSSTVASSTTEVSTATSSSTIESTVESSEVVANSESQTSSSIQESTETTQSSSVQNANDASVEKAYQAILTEFKEKLFGDWSAEQSNAKGIDFYGDYFNISLNEDLTYSLKVTTDQNDTVGQLYEDSGTFKISENGFKQTVAGLPQLVSTYDEFTELSNTLNRNYIQIRFTGTSGEVTIGALILPTGELVFDKSNLLFSDRMKSDLEFEKF